MVLAILSVSARDHMVIVMVLLGNLALVLENLIVSGKVEEPEELVEVVESYARKKKRSIINIKEVGVVLEALEGEASEKEAVLVEALDMEGKVAKVVLVKG
ncbi:hypothetical protein RchiOBHm_Chr3g0497161 [Rosa chinensis]|uniref:Uncharacterized protein n=1 Tax=Rosa chinensis TaxID=74649 RepID=A0A2P6RHP4_ROSCH|nr:hypothetical protein RchiOBHm_Chr3g0497161 [Rosa chinensis]